jgi:hypothetical protein
MRSHGGTIMKVNISNDLTEKVLALTHDYSYTPEEVISIGIALTNVVLKERAAGNQVVVIDPNGDQLSEFTEIAPQALDAIVEKYIESINDGFSEQSTAVPSTIPSKPEGCSFS